MHDAGTTIFRSRDDGTHWEQLDRGIPETAPCNIEAMSIAAWPGGYSLFLGDTDGAVYMSEDGGDSFTRIADAIGPISKGNHLGAAAARCRGIARLGLPPVGD